MLVSKGQNLAIRADSQFGRAAGRLGDGLDQKQLVVLIFIEEGEARSLDNQEAGRGGVLEEKTTLEVLAEGHSLDLRESVRSTQQEH